MLFLLFFIIFFFIYLGLEKIKINNGNETKRSILNIIYFIILLFFPNYVNIIVRGYRLLDTFLIFGNIDIYVYISSYEITYNLLNILVSFSVEPLFFIILGVSDIVISLSNIFQTLLYRNRQRYIKFLISRISLFIFLRIFFVFYYSWVYKYYTPFIWLLAFRSLLHLLMLK